MFFGRIDYRDSDRLVRLYDYCFWRAVGMDKKLQPVSMRNHRSPVLAGIKNNLLGERKSFITSDLLVSLTLISTPKSVCYVTFFTVISPTFFTLSSSTKRVSDLAREIVCSGLSRELAPRQSAAGWLHSTGE